MKTLLLLAVGATVLLGWVDDTGTSTRGPALPDIDVGVPPGTPLEWNKDLHRPVPTGGRMGVPTVNKPPGEDGGPQDAPPRDMKTTVERAPEPMTYGVTNLYDYFGITTIDIASHIQIETPPAGEKKNEDVGTGTGAKSGVRWVYPPAYTTETLWTGAAGCLRAILHPESISVPETVAYLCEVGEPTLVAAANVRGPVGHRVKKLISPLEANRVPPIKGGPTPLDTVINRMVTIELTSGFPHSLDPTFGRRTLTLGDDGYRAVLEAVKSDHRFLARNAVSVLANFRLPDAAEQLRKIFKSSPDAVMKYRAASGLVRRRDRGSVSLFKAGLGSSDEVHRAVCAYSLGMIGDPIVLPDLVAAAKRSNDRDYLWSLIPAIARLATAQELGIFMVLQKRIPSLPPLNYKDDSAPDKITDEPLKPPKEDPPGTKLKILEEMCFLGRAVAGEPASSRALLKRFEQKILDSFHTPNWFLAIDAVARLGKDGVPALKSVFHPKYGSGLQQHALIRLGELFPETEFLSQLSYSGHPAVRGLALRILADHDEKTFREVAFRIIGAYRSQADAGGAYVVGMAMQLLGELPKGNGNKVEQLSWIVDLALERKAWAYRDDNNEPDITKAKVQIHPPLLEVAAIELGRLGDPAGMPALLKVYRSKADRGRAEAVLAMGALRTNEGIEAVLNALDDPDDGWVRFCAYLAARKLSQQDHFCDWIFGSPHLRQPEIAKYRAWWKEQVK
ncbi:MAG: HEAT repeat domain-containing protein [Planctomycetes bacterium]|nr:HEAT repeat domain-containing protein [Planctomycetota bacterium]